MRKLKTLWDHWEPQPSWREILRLSAIELAFVLAVIAIFEIIFYGSVAFR